jgi:hypothetical protein
MVVWFCVMGGLGLAHISGAPGVLVAISPTHAAEFFARNAGRGFVVLGSVFLVVTGGEALYADMGHFDLLGRDRADLRSDCELSADAMHSGAGPWVPLLERDGGGVWGRGDEHDGDHHRAPLYS